MDKNYFPHDIKITDAAELQEEFAEQLVLEDKIPVAIKSIAGISVYSRGDQINVSICILEPEPDFTDFKVKEKEVITKKAKFPAVPAFEGFRDGKIIVDALKRLGVPQLLIIEGHGIDHPRGFGLASHIGLALDCSTIGVSQDLLGGDVKSQGGQEFVLKDGEILAKVVKKEVGSPKFYVSPGNKITLDTASKLIKKSMVSKVPEPIKIAKSNLLKEMTQP
ncbi:MAG: endonuclease V [Candidatus Undinarchaeales archaeon]